MSNISTGSLPFAKGHGTENDFLIINDPDGDLSLDPSRVAALCDRRAGLGADGLLRVIRAQALVDNGELDKLADGIDAMTGLWTTATQMARLLKCVAMAPAYLPTG